MNTKKLFFLERLQSDFCRGQKDKIVIIRPMHESATSITNLHPCFASEKTVIRFCIEGQERDNFFKCLVKFPTQNGNTKQEAILEISKGQVDSIEPFSLTTPRHLVTFNKDTINCALGSINKVGYICLMPKSMDISKKMVDYLLNDVKKRFKYNHLFSSHFGKIANNNKYTAIIEFFKLPYCLPVYNSKRVDGVGVSIKYVNADRYFLGDFSGNIILMHLHFVLSQFRENLFVVDGTQILGKNQIPSDTWLYVDQLHAHMDDFQKSKKEKVKTPKLTGKATLNIGNAVNTNTWVDTNPAINNTIINIINTNATVNATTF